MQTLNLLIISEKGLSRQTRKECEEGRLVMSTRKDLKVSFTYLVMPKVLDSLGSGGQPNLRSFAKKYEKTFENYHGTFIWCSNREWKKRNWRNSLYGLSTIYKNTYIKTIGRWSEFGRYQQSHNFPKPLNKLSELAIGLFHEVTHAVVRLAGLGSYALTHTFFYGYDRIYTKAEEKRLKPKRYIRTPNPLGLWKALPLNLKKINTWNYSHLNKKDFNYPERIHTKTLQNMNASMKEYGKKIRVTSDWRPKGSHSSGYELDIDINGGEFYKIIRKLYKRGQGKLFYRLILALSSSDFMKDDPQLRFAKIALKNGFNRIGFYNGHMHLGSDPSSPQNVVWTGTST